MSKIIQIMCKDKIVAQQAEVAGGWKIVSPHLMPHNLDLETEPNYNDELLNLLNGSCFVDAIDGIDDEKRQQILRRSDLSSHRWSRFREWLTERVLSINRVNARKILNSLVLSQNQSIEERANIALAFRGVSLCDSWWIKFGIDDSKTWNDVNLFRNSLSKTLALIGVSGGTMSLKAKNDIDSGRETTAELSTKGSYAKGWFREEDDNYLYLYKADFEGGESYREVCAYKVIDYFNVYGNLKYTYEKLKNPLTDKVSVCSRCRLMSNENKAIVHARELDAYLMRNGSNVIKYAKSYYMKEFAQMVVIDYLIANSDRHGENWAFIGVLIQG